MDMVINAFWQASIFSYSAEPKFNGGEDIAINYYKLIEM
jgi:hypothetical protein